MFTKKTDSAAEQATRRSRFGKAGAAAAVLAFAATAVPMALAGPAQATDDQHGDDHQGCEVWALKPVVHYNDHGKHDDYVDYRVKVHCDEGYGIELYDQRWEKDHGHDQYLGDWSKYDHFDQEDTSVYHIKKKAPDTEHGDEEVYHRVTYKVYYDGDWTGWHNWKKSHVEYVYQ
ncbi:hypothetical protein [Arthrobacter sp. Marseille-P9274]|uniref:hypothetical protein n=1 Tax=Arthrobacter sp. Marseille-P9274 TaxID=2866572 RepID=UPI0021C97418|nr:hypothetical protein [Arthrobacter sp. Marseille-P9274]